MSEYEEYDEYGMSAPQLHAGLDKLWKALGGQGVYATDVFTLAAKAIESTFVVLDHRCDADQLRSRIAYSIREQAEAKAAEVRERTGCLVTAIEVVELKRENLPPGA